MVANVTPDRSPPHDRRRGRDAEYFLYNSTADFQLHHVRRAILLCLGLLVTGTVHGQIQEKKLLDRLLKPDTSLQNNLQDKRFVAAGATLEKKARTKTFYVRARRPEKQFGGTRNVSTRTFPTESSRHHRTEANLETRSSVQNMEVAYSTSSYGGARSAREATKRVESTTYPGSRPFLARGKSQKSLSGQNPPLTIDQVRELLNKNK